MRSRWSDWSDWSDFEQPFALLDELRRRMDRVWSEYEVGREEVPRARYASGLEDEGRSLKLTAVLPGLSEKDIKLTANQDGLTVEAERKTEVPEGYSVHRRERPSLRFARSWTLPCPVDVEKITAKMTNGILTVELPKVPEAQPRQISVRAG
ncbi:MAG: Hsp20/alpha crystallin family protein [Micrococcales bacterium]|nr:Hsp20/alpha crystallin family protein [Micrococcales bacterium]